MMFNIQLRALLCSLQTSNNTLLYTQPWIMVLWTMNQKSLFGMKLCREQVVCEEEKSLVGARARIHSKIEE